MNRSNWTETSTSFGGSADFTVRVEPFFVNSPTDLQRIHLDGAADGVTLLLTVDQADQLEQELERARWHRVFMQHQLALVNTPAEGGETITKPDDAHSGGWTARIAPDVEQRT